MTITAQGCLSIPFADCETLLAHSAAFQAAVGVDTAEAAREFIHYDVNSLANEDNVLQPPFALIGEVPEEERLVLLEQQFDELHRGWLSLQLVFLVPEDESDLTDKERTLLRLNTPGLIVQEMLSLARSVIPDGGGETFWNLTGFRKTLPTRDHDRAKLEVADDEHNERTASITDLLLRWGQ